MGKLILFMHTSLDGIVAGPNGEMNWIIVDDEIFDYVGKFIGQTDTALYGRVTYELMENYWPTAADQPNASKHDIEHAQWYKKAAKIVLSNSMKGSDIKNTTIISGEIAGPVQDLKNKAAKNILIFGSPSASHALMEKGLIDEYWVFVNPVLMGTGIPLFKNVNTKTKLTLLESKVFSSGVTALHYSKTA